MKVQTDNEEGEAKSAKRNGRRRGGGECLNAKDRMSNLKDLAEK